VTRSTALELLEWSTELFVPAFGAVVLLSLLLGRIRIAGLLLDDGSPSAVKVQQCIIALTVAGNYALAIAHTSTPSRLPPLSDTLLTLSAGSNALFFARRLLVRLTLLGP
jgi:hypothetical protein